MWNFQTPKFLVLFLYFLSSCMSQSDSDLVRAQARWAVDLMGEVCGVENCVFSPYSIFNILAMVAMGSRGETSDQIMGVLQAGQKSFENNIIFHEQLGILKKRLGQTNGLEGVEFRVADNVFVGSAPLRAQYSEDLRRVYQVDGPQVVDFVDTGSAVEAINDFVSNVTKGEIKDFLTSDAVSPETLAVLVNAIFFKGSWAIQFDEEKTQKANFSISRREKILVDMMQVQGEFRFSQARSQEEYPKFDILELPYENTDFTMNILLPYTALNTARDDIKASDLLVNFESRLPPLGGSVLVQLPKFTVSVKTDLKQALTNLGMSDLFTSAADLSGIAGDPEDPVYVSSAIHEAKIDVNEQGTKATAATAVGIVFESSVDLFQVNQPFMFTLVHKPTQALLLLGQVVDPFQSSQ